MKTLNLIFSFLIVSISRFNVGLHIKGIGGKYLSNSFPSAISPNNPLYANSWHLRRIKADLAWSITNGLSRVNVGFFDTGIDYSSSSDLNDNINYLLSVDCYGNHNRSPFLDSKIHGTSVASIFGSKCYSLNSISGVSRNCSIVSLKCDDNNNSPNLDAVEYGLDYCSTNYNEIQIVNLNVSFFLSSSEISDFFSSVDDYEGLIVVPADNNGINLDTFPYEFYPQKFDNDNIIVVGASNEFDQIASSLNGNNPWASNYGEYIVDLFAPGINLPSLPLQNPSLDPLLFSGTCGATPLVSATAALIKSVNPTYSTAQIKSAILDNVDYVSDFDGLCVSKGRLNTYEAVKSAIPEYNVSLGTTMNCIQYLNPNESQFYKVTLPAGSYYFETTGNLDMTGSLYTDIQSFPLGISLNPSGNAFISKNLNSTTTIYFKVQNISSSSGNYGIKISSSGHVHSYNSYHLWNSSIDHKSFCGCGAYSISPHCVTFDEPHTCLLCGGYAEFGTVNSFGEELERIGNDSIIIQSGIIVLGEVDYSLFLNEVISVEQLLNTREH